MASVQRLLTFSNPPRKLPADFLETFDALLLAKHGAGITSIKEAKEGESGFRVEGRGKSWRLRGICFELREVFANTEVSAEIDKRRRRKSNTSTRAMGDLVHRHIYHQIECRRAGECACKTRTPDKPTALASRLLLAVREMGWTPVHSEMGIACPPLKLATQVDCLCYDVSRSEFILVSWKTGYRDVEKQIDTSRQTHIDGKHARTMNHPLAFVTDNERERNQLQLMCEYLILERQYDIKPAKAVVFYACGGKDGDEKIVTDWAAWWWWGDGADRTRDPVWKELAKSAAKR